MRVRANCQPETDNEADGTPPRKGVGHRRPPGGQRAGTLGPQHACKQPLREHKPPTQGSSPPAPAPPTRTPNPIPPNPERFLRTLHHLRGHAPPAELREPSSLRAQGPSLGEDRLLAAHSGAHPCLADSRLAVSTRFTRPRSGTPEGGRSRRWGCGGLSHILSFLNRKLKAREEQQEPGTHRGGALQDRRTATRTELPQGRCFSL